MSIYDGTLVKLEYTRDFLVVRTYSRAHGRKGRFLIEPDRLERWLTDDGDLGKSEYLERDIGHFMSAKKRGGYIHLMILWHYGSSGTRTIYDEQHIDLPVDVLLRVLQGESIRHLHVEKDRRSKLDFANAGTVIKRICEDKRKRRAFSKALRTTFNWGGSFISFYNDGAQCSLYFRERGSICGGLVLHDYMTKTPIGEVRRYEYSMHT